MTHGIAVSDEDTYRLTLELGGVKYGASLRAPGSIDNFDPKKYAAAVSRMVFDAVVDNLRGFPRPVDPYAEIGVLDSSY